jgi:hypothetical protein
MEVREEILNHQAAINLKLKNRPYSPYEEKLRR